MKPDMHHAIASLASMQCGEGKLLDSYDMYEVRGMSEIHRLVYAKVSYLL